MFKELRNEGVNKNTHYTLHIQQKFAYMQYFY